MWLPVSTEIKAQIRTAAHNFHRQRCSGCLVGLNVCIWPIASSHEERAFLNAMRLQLHLCKRPAQWCI